MNRQEPEQENQSFLKRWLAATVASALTVSGIPLPAVAAMTDLSPLPIAATSAVQAKPNIMLLMDTSGSMAWSHMPDEVESVTKIDSIGYKSPQCNAIYYNRLIDYPLPKLPSGLFFPQPNFGGAPYNGYASYLTVADATDLSMPDLGAQFRAYDAKTLRATTSVPPDPAQPAYYYIYTGAQLPLNYTSVPCLQSDVNATVAATGGGTWTRVLVSSTSGPPTRVDERNNFAVWYSFYRTRINLIKSAASLAFNPLNDSFRVGFITVEPKTNATDAAINPAKYVPIADFDIGQRNLWFSKIFSQPAEGASPAREGLARVGRHYAGRQDGINNGMTGDPVQYSCQQNFTIMTTDGYWNSQTETPGGGPVQIDGVSRVGQQDGNFTPFPGYTPRPIWEGNTTDTVVVTDNVNTFSYGDCGSYITQSTQQLSISTSQLVQDTSQLVTRTVQTTASTSQVSIATTRQTESTLQHRQSTSQTFVDTSQWARSTTQDVEYTTQTVELIEQVQMRQERIDQSTSQRTRSTTQETQSTSQLQQNTLQTRIQTARVDRDTSQVTQRTDRTTQSTSQMNSQTSQINRSTSQMQQSTLQVRQSTSQDRVCDSRDETCSPVATGSCSPAGFFYCETVTTGPTLVASCTASGANAGNNYVTTTCMPTATGPTAVASCTAAAPIAGNNFTQTTCNPVLTGPTPVATCTASGPIAGNSYVDTTCNTILGAMTPVASCVSVLATAGNSYTATNCVPVNTGPTAVDATTCTVNVAANAGNNWTATTCTPISTGPVGVSSCATISPVPGNNWTTTSCNTVTTGPTPVSSCTNAAAAAGNSWVTTNCTPVNSGPTPVASCSPSGGNVGNSWTTTTCPNVIGTPVGVASCTTVAGNAGNSYTATTCNTVNTGPTGVAACTPDPASGANSYVDTTCNTVNTGPTPIAAALCPSNIAAAAGNFWTATTCATNATGPTPVATCNAAVAGAGNSWTATTCNVVVVSPWTDVTSCTPVPPSIGNGFVATLCRNNVVSNTAVGTCTPGTNGTGQTTSCTTINTGPTGVPPGSCVAQTGNAGNGWLTRTCGTLTTGPTLVAACTPAIPAVANQWTQTTCANTTTGPTAVASCTAQPANAGNSFTATNCTTNTTGPTGVQVCTPDPPTGANNYVTTSCADLTTGPTPRQTCTPVPPSAGNNWVDLTCATINTGPTLVASCTPVIATAGNNWTTTSCPTVTTGPTPVSSCVNDPPNAGNSFVATTCNTTTSPNVGVASCTPDPATAINNWVETQCVTVTTSNGVSSCSGSAANAGNNWTATNCNTVNTGPTLTASCTAAPAAAGNSWTATSCGSVLTGPTVVGSCTAQGAVPGNNFVSTTCGTTAGRKIRYSTQTTTTTTRFNNGTQIGLPVVNVINSLPTDLTGTCYAPGTEPPLPAPNPQTAGLAAGPYPPAPCVAWPCTVSTANSFGSIDSLADVAQYYYVTDLRPGMVDDVPVAGSGPEGDRATWQHMTTFTIGLGVSGTLNYRADYKRASTITGDFADIRTGVKDWPVWPQNPAAQYDPALGGSYANWNNPKSIDDFWHTAVNGRGTYFSADRPGTIVTGLAQALAGATERVGFAPLSVSNPEPTVGNNFAYTPSYTTVKWIGDVQASDINLTTGAVTSTVNWSAQTKLNARTGQACDTRQIYLMRPGAANNLVNFTSNTFLCDGAGNPTGAPNTGLNAAELLNFNAATVSNLSHYLAMTDGTAGTPDQRTPAAGDNLVNFLRGQRGQEGFVPYDPNDPLWVNKLYRARDAVLGDIVGSQAVYVKSPYLSYQDAGYNAFRTAQAGRTPMVYVAANDGMLHAFYAGATSGDPQGGQEAWAFMPTSVLPDLYRLADNNYANVHRMFLDGTPTVADVNDAGTWKTVLVGGMAGGGKAYYALDVTDPIAPKALWEFKWSNTCYNGTPATAGADCHIGYTFGKPVITKLSDGTWVVMVTSGYNNVNAPPQAGDGVGYLYILDAVTGQIRYKISTGVGDATTPSGLAQINNFIDYPSINNTTRQVYGGDLLGNVWRFDVNDAIAPAGREAALLGVATAPTTNAPQPITTRPELAELNAKPIVLVGTGRLLGATDFSNTVGQSVYGIVDTLGSGPVYGNLRTTFKPLAMTPSGGIRTIACTGTALQCGSADGWVIDLPDSGERVNIDMRLARGTLVFASNVPNSVNPCVTGGYSWLNFVSFASGGSVSTSPGNAVSVSTVNSLAVGLNLIRVDGKLVGLRQMSGAFPGGGGPGSGSDRSEVPEDTPAPTGKRISWREIAQ